MFVCPGCPVAPAEIWHSVALLEVRGGHFGFNMAAKKATKFQLRYAIKLPDGHSSMAEGVPEPY